MADRALPADFERVLVICTRQIGDVLLTTPLIRAARLRWPRAVIDVLGFAGSLQMLVGNPDIRELIELNPKAGWRAAPSLLRRLWRRYDLAVITQRSDREYMLGWVAAKVRTGFVPGLQIGNRWKRWVLSYEADDAFETLHQAADKLRLLAPWGAEPQAVQVVPPADAELPAWLQSQLRAGFIVIHVPSMWRFKQWPPDHFRELIRMLSARGLQLVLSGGPSEQDRALVASMTDLGSPPDLIDVAGKLDLAQMSCLLRKAALYIGPDTSVTHLAAAHGTPTIALFGPTNPVVWGPWPRGAQGKAPFFPHADGVQHVGPVALLQGPQPCVPCRQEGCQRHRDSASDCLAAITPERVARLVSSMLG